MKEGVRLKINSCETHINHALDVFVAEQGIFPIMAALPDEEKLSTKCSYCEEFALYVVANE
jgi:CxxH/CxxC protein (TIGR04129 family)